MGSFAHFDHICRLCATESNDLISLLDKTNHDRDLAAILKKYIRVTVSVQDGLPHQICGPCLAKLDEVVSFIDTACATQNNLKHQIKDASNDDNVRVSEDQLYDLIQDVKVELEEVVEDEDDQDYEPPKASRSRGVRGRPKTKRGNSGKRTGRTRKAQSTEAEVTRESEDVQPSESSSVKMEVKERLTEGKDCLEKDPLEIATRNHGDDVGPVEMEEMGKCIKYSVRCCFCKAPFSQASQLATHSREVHQVQELRYMCSQCPVVFAKISSLNNHQRVKHHDFLQRCPKCKKLYPRHYLWTRHMLVHTNTRPFSCDECEKKFKSKAELYNHKKTHRPSEERYTHCCEFCGKRFTQKANLESHLRLHTGNRPFSCEYCGKCFSQRGNMEEHRRIHTGEKPFVCHICGLSYSRQGQLAMHKRKHTGEKPHKCRFCPKEFLRREVLRKHEHVHTDTRPFQCAYCDKRFRDQGKRKVHERLHTGERPFECKVCGRGFCESGNLRKHLRVHQRHPRAAVKETPLGNVSAVATTSGTTYSIPQIPHSTISLQGLSATGRHTVEALTENPVLIVPETSVDMPGAHASAEPLPLATSSSVSLSVAGPPVGTTNCPLVPLRPLEEPRENSTLPPREDIDRDDDYRISSTTAFQTVTWALYQT